MKTIIIKHSSNIVEITYEKEGIKDKKGILRVYFKNSLCYRYNDIPEKIFDDLSHVNSVGESVGKTLHRLVLSQSRYKGIKDV